MIKIAVTPYSNWRGLPAWLEAMGQKAVDTEAAESWYLDGVRDGEPHDSVLLATCRPEIALQWAMQEGVAPASALTRWMEHAQAMLAYFKANRGHSVLIDLGELQRAPASAATALARRWALADSRPESLPALDSAYPSLERLNQTTFPLMARQAMNEMQATLRPLLAQLEACSLPLTDPVDADPVVPVDSLFEEWQAAVAELENRHAQAVVHWEKAGQAKDEENASLLEQLHSVQEELERMTHRVEAQDQQLEQAEAARHSLERQLEQAQSARQSAEQKHSAYQTLQHANESLQEENGLLLEQLHRVQEELERVCPEGRAGMSRHAQAREDRLLAQLERIQHELLEFKARQREVERESALALAAANQKVAALSAQLEQQGGLAFWKGKGAKGRRRGKSRQWSRDKQLVEESGLFDRDWYLQTYPDVAEAGVDPVEHYLRAGAGEGRNPSPDFDTAWYLMTYRDVAESGVNPLIHFVKFGRNEQRAPGPRPRTFKE